MHTPSVNQTREGVPEYVEKSTVLKEVYSKLPKRVREELDAAVRDFGIRTLARVYTELRGDDIYVYVLLYEVSEDGAEWVTVVAGDSFVDYRVVEGTMLINGTYYLPKNPDVARRLAKQVLRATAQLRSGDWRVGSKAEEYIRKFKRQRGERA